MLMVAVSIHVWFLGPGCLSLLPQDINEAKILAAANQFISLGLKTAGYQYVNIDVRISSNHRSAPQLISILGLLVEDGS